MERTPKLIASVAVIAIIFIGLGIYAYIQSREYLRGPVIVVQEPPNGSLSTTTRVFLLGTARNVAFMTLNGKQIFTDDRGRFRESLLLQEGYNIITVAAKDRFGKNVEKRLELVYKPEHDTNATNTPSELHE